MTCFLLSGPPGMKLWTLPPREAQQPRQTTECPQPSSSSIESRASHPGLGRAEGPRDLPRNPSSIAQDFQKESRAEEPAERQATPAPLRSRPRSCSPALPSLVNTTMRIPLHSSASHMEGTLPGTQGQAEPVFTVPHSPQKTPVPRTQCLSVAIH